MDSCLLEFSNDTNDEYDDIEDFDADSHSDVASFYSEMEPLIKQCIKNYFINKFLHNGKKISKEILDLPYYSVLIFNTTVSDGVNKAYFLMEENNFLSENDEESSMSKEIRYMINLISNIHKKVPQEFVGGMVLMHLELIEGIEIW